MPRDLIEAARKYASRNRLETDKREKFGLRWPEVQAALAALEDYGIHMLDVNPGNVAFAD